MDQTFTGTPLGRLEEIAAELEVLEFDCAEVAAKCRSRGDERKAERWAARRLAYGDAARLLRKG